MGIKEEIISKLEIILKNMKEKHGIEGNLEVNLGTMVEKSKGSSSDISITCFALAKPFKKSPVDIANEIAENLEKEKLSYIRKTLFAKKGYKFKNPKYSSYFSQKSWYNGIYDSDEILNPEEKRFVLIIKEREK